MKRLTIRGTALALGVFFDVSLVLCVLWGLAIPQFHANWLLEGLLPGFIWLSPQSIVLGLVEAFLFGVYIALVFVPLFNYFEGGRPSEVGTPTATQPALPREAVSHH
jgi:hypothetical protein